MEIEIVHMYNMDSTYSYLSGYIDHILSLRDMTDIFGDITDEKRYQRKVTDIKRTAQISQISNEDRHGSYSVSKSITALRSGFL